jgi:hypothetical protein
MISTDIKYVHKKSVRGQNVYDFQERPLNIKVWTITKEIFTVDWGRLWCLYEPSDLYINQCVLIICIYTDI